MKIYMAGPLFTSAECEFNRQLAGYLRGKGHQVFLPQESEKNLRIDESADPAADIFSSDVCAIDSCDLVIANLDGPDPDSGTSWEIGYAYALDKDIICFRTDMRVHEGFDPVNLMLTESADATIFFKPTDGPLEIALALMEQAAAIETERNTFDD